MINLFNLPRRENDSPNRKADLKIHIESIPQYVPLYLFIIYIYIYMYIYIYIYVATKDHLDPLLMLLRVLV